MRNTTGFPDYIFRDDNWDLDQELLKNFMNSEPVISPAKTEEVENKEKDLIPWNQAYYSPRLSPQWFIDLAWLSLSDFSDKKIVDIGWWAGCLALLIQNEWTPQSVEIVDTIFDEYPFDTVVKQVIKNLKSLIKSPGRYTAEQIKSEKVLEKYENWEYEWVKINWSSGDKIDWLEDNSQDIVFINHLLHKLNQDYTKILKEADRVLKDDGEIIVIEYPEPSINSIMINKSRELNLVTSEIKDALCIKIKKWERKKFL